MALHLGPRVLPESGQQRKQIWRESRQASERKAGGLGRYPRWVAVAVVYPRPFLCQVKKSDSKTFETLGEQQTKQNQNGNKNEGKLIYNYQLLNFY